MERSYIQLSRGRYEVFSLVYESVFLRNFLESVVFQKNYSCIGSGGFKYTRMDFGEEVPEWEWDNQRLKPEDATLKT